MDPLKSHCSPRGPAKWRATTFPSCIIDHCLQNLTACATGPAHSILFLTYLFLERISPPPHFLSYTFTCHCSSLRSYFFIKLAPFLSPCSSYSHSNLFSYLFLILCFILVSLSVLPLPFISFQALIFIHMKPVFFYTFKLLM